MDFDMTKVYKIALSKTKKASIDLSEEEIAFMSNIFNFIIDSENYDIAMKYLAGIYGMKLSDIKMIKSVYGFYLASNHEKIIYSNKMESKRRKMGLLI